MVFPNSFCLLVCSCFIILGDLLWIILFTYCTQFFFLVVLYFVQNWGYINSSANPVFALKSVQVHTAAVLLASLTFMVQFSLPYNRDKRTNVLYNFILVFLFPVVWTHCLQCLVFSNCYLICCQCPLLFHKIPNFKQLKEFTSSIIMLSIKILLLSGYCPLTLSSPN